MRSVMADPVKVVSLLKCTPTACHTEVEISHDESDGLVARCVVDIDAARKCQFDKPRFSALIKRQLASDYPQLKIEKRAVDAVDDPPAI